MNDSKAPEELVRKLFQAEQDADSGPVKDIVTDDGDFTITRGDGRVQNKTEMVAEVEHPRNRFDSREPSEFKVKVHEGGQCAVVRCLLTTTKTENGQAVKGHFRNIHVFFQQQGQWRCVAWQVTRIAEPDNSPISDALHAVAQAIAPSAKAPAIQGARTVGPRRPVAFAPRQDR